MKRTNVLMQVAGLAIAATSLSSPAHGATVTLNGSDPFGASSFNMSGAAAGWSDGLAPHAGGDYVTGENRMRTPADGGSHTFGGDSLTVNNTNALNGGVMYKGTGTTGVLTINNLILAGGQLHHQNGVGDLFQLAGNINVTANSTIHAKQGNIDILAPISGTANLSIPATDAPAENNRFVTLRAANSFTGNIDVAGRLALADTGGLSFDIGASGVNNSITGAGSANFNGSFNFDLSGAGASVGDSWQIVANPTLTETFGSTFSVAGFTDNGNDSWSTTANSVTYTFDEATGVLSVVPEPASLGLLTVAALAGLTRRRR